MGRCSLRLKLEQNSIYMTLLLLFALGLFACADQPPPDAPKLAHMTGEMGMGWGGGGAGGSTIPAPVVTALPDVAFEGLVAPHRIAVGADGTFVVTDPRAHAVHVLWADLSPRLRIDAVAEPLGCAVDAGGRIYVGDGASRTVRVFDVGGASAGALGDGQLMAPGELAFDALNGRVLVADGPADRVVGLDAVTGDVTLLVQAGQAGVPGFHFPTGLAVDEAAGRLYVADHGGGRIVVLTLDGAPVTTLGAYGGGDGQLARPQGLALDSTGRLYVADAYQGRVQALDSTGKHIAWVGTYGAGPGQLALPSDLVVDPWGRLVVTSYRGGHLSVFGLDAWQEPPPPPPPPPPAQLALAVAAHPDALALDAKRKWVKLHIARLDDAVLPETILVDGQPPANVSGEDDEDDDEGLQVRISAQELIQRLGAPGQHVLLVTAQLASGASALGEAPIEILPKKKEGKQ